jgi:hypothetical protein
VFREVATGDVVMAGWSVTNANVIQATFTNPPASNSIRAVVIV